MHTDSCFDLITVRVIRDILRYRKKPWPLAGPRNNFREATSTTETIATASTTSIHLYIITLPIVMQIDKNNSNKCAKINSLQIFNLHH